MSAAGLAFTLELLSRLKLLVSTLDCVHQQVDRLGQLQHYAHTGDFLIRAKVVKVKKLIYRAEAVLVLCRCSVLKKAITVFFSHFEWHPQPVKTAQVMQCGCGKCYIGVTLAFVLVHRLHACLAISRHLLQHISQISLWLVMCLSAESFVSGLSLPMSMARVHL